jgi:ABC-type phosphate transport system ATPase subunit
MTEDADWANKLSQLDKSALYLAMTVTTCVNIPRLDEQCLKPTKSGTNRLETYIGELHKRQITLTMETAKLSSGDRLAGYMDALNFARI